MEFRKPIIAAITGFCVAGAYVQYVIYLFIFNLVISNMIYINDSGGLELALMCDLRVMEENAKVGFLNRRFGVPLMDGGRVNFPFNSYCL